MKKIHQFNPADKINSFFRKYKRAARESFFVTALSFVVVSLAIALVQDLWKNGGLNKDGFLYATIAAALSFPLVTLINTFPGPQLPGSEKERRGFRYITDTVKGKKALDQLNALNREAFKDATIDDYRASAILRKNVKAGFGLFEEDLHDESRRLVGSAECWPVTKGTLERLKLGEGIEGGLSEEDFQLGDLLSDREIDKTEAIYIPSVVVKDAGTPAGLHRAGSLMLKFLPYIQETFRQAAINQNGLTIFIICFTDEGTAMTEKIAKFFRMDKPTSDLIIYGKRRTYYEIRIPAEKWNSSFDLSRIKWAESAFFDD
jgi:hypothetical protein